MITPDPDLEARARAFAAQGRSEHEQCLHERLVEGYYGHNCADCGVFLYPYGNAPWDDSDDDVDEWDDDEDEWLSRCAWVRSQGCQLAGTEECDFECPFRDGNYRGLRLTQARMAKRAAQKTT